jgi:hypothetical protein
MVERSLTIPEKEKVAKTKIFMLIIDWLNCLLN